MILKDANGCLIPISQLNDREEYTLIFEDGLEVHNIPLGGKKNVGK